MVRPLYVPYCPTTNAKWGQLDYGVEFEFAQKRNYEYDFNAKWVNLIMEVILNAHNSSYIIFVHIQICQFPIGTISLLTMHKLY